MTDILQLAIVLVGLAATAVLFFHFPKLSGKTELPESLPSISVIIPARNEEMNMNLLLSDLKQQDYLALEIICVDDASEDQTAAVAHAHGVRIITVRDKPEDWVGKTWACQCGAAVAQGDHLLFLDADVRLGKNGISKLVSARSTGGGTISVQPYHRTEKKYEQFSMIFNLVQIAANGIALPWHTTTGLYGPVILISQKDYMTIGGHSAVKTSIVEDMALGTLLEQKGLPYRVFIGDADIAFRMYGNGIRDLLEGWTKNLATGAAKTPISVFLLVFFWIASMTSAPLHLITALVTTDWLYVGLYGGLYSVWAVSLRALSKKIGYFSLWASLLYPFLLLAFLFVFLVSTYKKIFRLKVRWKGRDIALEKK